MGKTKWEDKKCGCGCGEPVDYKVVLTLFHTAGHYERVLRKLSEGSSSGEEREHA